MKTTPYVEDFHVIPYVTEGLRALGTTEPSKPKPDAAKALADVCPWDCFVADLPASVSLVTSLEAIVDGCREKVSPASTLGK